MKKYYVIKLQAVLRNLIKPLWISHVSDRRVESVITAFCCIMSCYYVRLYITTFHSYNIRDKWGMMMSLWLTSIFLPPLWPPQKKKKVAMVRCELFLVSVLTLVCALFRVQIGGGDNGVICVSGFNRSHKGNPGAGWLGSVFFREVRVKAQQNTFPQLPFSSPGQRTELSLIAGGLLGGKGASNRSKAHTDAEKMIYYRYNQIAQSSFSKTSKKYAKAL